MAIILWNTNFHSGQRRWPATAAHWVLYSEGVPHDSAAPPLINIIYFRGLALRGPICLFHCSL